jgi:cytochrome c-type biogenesis protein CcmH
VILFFVLAGVLAIALAVYIARPLWRSGDRVRAVAAGLVPAVLAVGLYLGLGAPQLAGLSSSALTDEAQRELEATVAELKAAADAAPQDAAVWRRLAAAYREIPNYAEAASAFAHLIELTPDDVSLKSAWGEAVVLSRGGVVPPEARAAFEEALAADASDVRARYYIAEAKYQAGRPDEAIADWAELAASAGPGGAPWLVTVARRLDRAAQMQERSLDGLGMPPETVAALEAALRGEMGGPRGPSAADVAAAADMTPEQQAAMIEGMVAQLAARLEQNPDDLEGWRMAARSYRQLNRGEDWVDALANIVRLSPDDFNAVRDHAYGLWLVRTESGPPDAETVAALENLLVLDPHDPVAHIGLAEVARDAGDAARATELLQSLADDETAPAMLREEALRQLGEMNGATEPAAEEVATP